MTAANLTRLVEEVRDEYTRIHGAPGYINDGQCGVFAHEVIRRYRAEYPQDEPSPKLVWLADHFSMPNYKDLLNHAVILYRGYYYDSDVPQGMPAVCPLFIPTWLAAVEKRTFAFAHRS